MPVRDQSDKGVTVGAEESAGGRSESLAGSGGRSQRGLVGTAELLVTKG